MFQTKSYQYEQVRGAVTWLDVNTYCVSFPSLPFHSVFPYFVSLVPPPLLSVTVNQLLVINII